MTRLGPRQARESGMALLVVLWTVAALSIFVASLGGMVRREAAVATVQRSLVEGRAIGEAAIYLALAEVRSNGGFPSSYKEEGKMWQQHQVHMQLVPWSGLVNVNSAPLPIWSMLLEKAAGVPAGQAAQLAQKIFDAQQSAQGLGEAWESPEDLLQVDGINYLIFEAMRPYLVAEGGGRASVSLSSAPIDLRNWLSVSGLGGEHSNTSGLLRFIARVSMQDKGYVVVERDFLVRSNPSDGQWWTSLNAHHFWLAQSR